MNCPKCKEGMETINSRKYGTYVRRMRRCKKCGHREKTVESFGESPTTVAGWMKIISERDRAIGALGVLVYDGLITSGRMRELIDMDIYRQRDELKRLLGVE